ncbi:MAG: hypothetical protein JSU57_00015 [Candidatus Heimdallarchaeota archaeon]|nr:MAG: hypothetical protein JSU57_00015 [Candidatus Heimdallarchaeota archaeon]
MNILFGIVLILLIIFTYRVTNTYRLKQIKLAFHRFEKARTEYIEPPRPYSKSYIELIQLLSSIHSIKQKKLILIISQMIKDYAILTGHISNVKWSEDLSLLINNPNMWYRNYSNEISLITQPGVFRKKNSSTIFYQKLINILTEVQQVFGIPLIPKME